MSRVILISAAWAANDLDAAGGLRGLSGAQRQKLLEGPERAPTTVGDAPMRGCPPSGRRRRPHDVAAGAVLGATGAMAPGSLLRGIRGLLRRER